MAEKQSFSIKGNRKNKALVEHVAEAVFTVCALLAVVAVASITVYMIINGTPALFKVGIKEILFGTVWQPAAKDPSFGILYVILTSIVGTTAAVLIGAPVGILTAVFIEEIASPRLAAIVKPAVELLAGIPSVIYGLLGIYLLNPMMYKLEIALFADAPDHQFTGGANLISAVIVLAVMILPTVINVTVSALHAVPKQQKAASLAMGATRIQTIFKVLLPSARSGIAAAVVLGTGRAIGEAMAIIMVAGNVANMPGLFTSVRFLTTAIASEMSYASVGSLQRQALFSIGLVLFLFIMLINVFLNVCIKRKKEN